MVLYKESCCEICSYMSNGCPYMDNMICPYFPLKYWLQCEGRSGCRCERMGPMLHCYTSPEQPSPILQNFDNSKEGQQQEKRQSHQNLNNFNKFSWNEWLNFIINLQSSSNICNQVWQDRRYQYYFISPAVRIRGRSVPKKWEG